MASIWSIRILQHISFSCLPCCGDYIYYFLTPTPVTITYFSYYYPTPIFQRGHTTIIPENGSEYYKNQCFSIYEVLRIGNGKRVPLWSRVGRFVTFHLFYIKIKPTTSPWSVWNSQPDNIFVMNKKMDLKMYSDSHQASPYFTMN